MTNLKSEINNKIKTLQELNKELDDYDNFLDLLIKNESQLEFNKLNEEISPKDRMDLNWNMGFSTYTLYFYPRGHEIKDEMKRVQDFYSKIQDANSFPTISQNNSNINKEACDRMIKNLINSKEELQTRKVKKSVPVPETLHLNWQKNLK